MQVVYMNINDREAVWIFLDNECPNITQMLQLLIEYVYPIITNIRI